VVTILSGAADVDLWLFIVSAILARGARFLVLAWLIRRYDDSIRAFVERRFGQVVAGIVIAIILLFVATRFL
jgi:membrane protein DedA with SNARE-associated domain